MFERQGSRTDQVIAKMARRLEQPKKGNNELPAVVQPVAAQQQWVNVAKAASELVDAVTGVPVAGLAVALLRAISGAEDAQTAMLKSIAQDVSLIREGPFRSAQKYLEIARANGRKHPRYEHQLGQAQHQLVLAYGHAGSAQEKSVICYHLGLVALLRSDIDQADPKLRESYKDEAELQLRESYGHCRSVVGTLAEDLTKTSLSEKLKKNLDRIADDHPSATEAGGLAALGVITVSGAAAFVAPLVAGAVVVNSADKLNRARRNYRVGTKLESYAPFVNAVVRTLNAVLGNAAQPGLALCGDTTIGYQLKWAALES